MLLAWSGVKRDSLRFDLPAGPVRRGGAAILIAALALYPLLAPLAGRPWRQAEIVGVAPDPTAIATVGVLLLASGRIPWLLLGLPLLWCAISALTLWTMDSSQAAAPLLVLAVVAAAIAWNARRGRDKAGAIPPAGK
jgi:hypothetical protein